MRVFLSYENRTHEGLAKEIAEQVEMNGYDVWFDKKRRRTLLRWLARSEESDFGIDGWLRKGMYSSNQLLAVVPYYRRAKGIPESWGIYRPENAQKLADIVNDQVSILIKSYQGHAPDQWDNPHKLDKFAHYMAHPIHTFRTVWYEVKVGVPLGKDPFEQWRRWEMRVGGYLKLRTCAVVPIEPEDDHLADEVTEIFSKINYIIIVRRSQLETDIKNKLVPALQDRTPTREENEFTRSQARKVRRFENRLTLRIILITAAILAVDIFAVKGLHRLHVNGILVAIIAIILLIAMPVGLILFVPLIKE
jgi:hypothetical protein